MTSSSSLYGSTSTNGTVSSSNMTTLYSGGNGPAPSGNFVIPGTLTVNGCAILTNCSSFSLLPTNAETILFGGASTAMSIGSSTGTTTINNQLATANYTFPVADGVSGQVLVTDGAGTVSFAPASTVGKTYSIDASATTGGANFNLVSSDPSTDTIKFASGTGITVSRTDANTITITNSDPGSAGVTSITGTANQVIASASTGAVTLSTPQDIATTSTPTFAGANLGNVTVGVVDDQTISTSTGNLNLIPNSSSYVEIVSDSATPTVITRNNVGTNNNIRSLALNVQSTGTPAVGFGNALEFQLEAQPGNTEAAGRLNITSTDLTAGSEDFDFVVQLMNNGATAAERFRVNSYGGTTITRLVPDTNISTQGLLLKATSSGTTAAGFGTSFDIYLQLPSGTTSRTGYIDNIITDGTVGSEDVQMNFGIMSNGTTTTKMALANTGILTTYGYKITGTSSGSSQFTAPATGSTLTYVLPGSAGGANTVLTNDGSGNLSWALPGGGGSTFGNITIAVDTDNTISTTTGDLILDSATGVIDINGRLNIDDQATFDTTTLTTTSTSTVALATTTRNMMNIMVNIIQGTNTHCVNATLLRTSSSTAMLTTYGELYDNIVLANFTADVDSGNLRLLITPTSATSTVFSAVRTALT